jgi:uncharacterized protein YukE
VGTELTDFQSAFDRVAQGPRKLDSGAWKGEAAEAFREKLGTQAGQWTHAADACESAAAALNSFAGTVTWAQGQAQEAIEPSGARTPSQRTGTHSGSTRNWP